MDHAPHLVLRADAGVSRGLGHAVRSITLGAEFVRRGWSVTLVASELADLPASLAQNHGIRVDYVSVKIGSRADAEHLTSIPADLIIIDGYDFNQAFFTLLGACGTPFGVIDDNGESFTPYARFVINQNLHARRDLYPADAAAMFLLGPEFALIRDEVRSIDRSEPTNRNPRSVLVAIGGTDVAGANARVAEYLAEDAALAVLVAGGDTPPGTQPAACDVANDLGSASCAVIGAGSTMWEACYLETPFVALIVAENQLAAAQAVMQRNVGLVIDCRSGVDPQSVAAMVRGLLEDSNRRLGEATREGRIIDGTGVVRTADYLERSVIGASL